MTDREGCDKLISVYAILQSISLVTKHDRIGGEDDEEDDMFDVDRAFIDGHGDPLLGLQPARGVKSRVRFERKKRRLGGR